MKKNILSIFKNSKRIIEQKKQIRIEIYNLKKLLTQEKKNFEAGVVFQKIESLSEFKAAKTILMFWSTADELPTHDIIKKWCEEKEIILPTVNGDNILLKKYSPDIHMIQGQLGIYEPDLKEKFEGKIDLAIVPGIAFDWRKNRLGRGKGYYDRFLKSNKIPKIGVGFDIQLVNFIPTNRMDRKMNKIITCSNTVN